MENFTHKTLETKPFGLTYSYYLSPNFKPSASAPTLLFAHGFPDDAFMWAGAIPHLIDLPYPIILLDILGFGHSSKPTEPSKYNYLHQANSIAQILDTEGVSGDVIPIGHDWGSAIVQRFYLYHRHRCVGLSLLSLAYQIPSPDPFDLDEANRATAKRFGYPQWEYWNFFTAPDAPRLMRDNLERFYQVNNGTFPSPLPEEHGRDIWMREMFCKPGAMRAYVTGTGEHAGHTVELKGTSIDDAAHTRLRRRFVDRLSASGLEPAVCYYHSLKNNTMLEDERALCSPVDRRKISVPVLYIGQTGDWVCRTDLMVDAKEQGLVDDVEEHAVSAGHWVLYEKPEEIAAIIRQWLLKRFPVKQ